MTPALLRRPDPLLVPSPLCGTLAQLRQWTEHITGVTPHPAELPAAEVQAVEQALGMRIPDSVLAWLASRDLASRRRFSALDAIPMNSRRAWSAGVPADQVVLGSTEDRIHAVTSAVHPLVFVYERGQGFTQAVLPAFVARCALALAEEAGAREPRAPLRPFEPRLT